MADELARIEIRVESGSAKAATTNLDALAKSTAAAEGAVGKMGEASNAAGVRTRKYAEILSSIEASSRTSASALGAIQQAQTATATSAEKSAGMMQRLVEVLTALSSALGVSTRATQANATAETAAAKAADDATKATRKRGDALRESIAATSAASSANTALTARLGAASRASDSMAVASQKVQAALLPVADSAARSTGALNAVAKATQAMGAAAGQASGMSAALQRMLKQTADVATRANDAVGATGGIRAAIAATEQASAANTTLRDRLRAASTAADAETGSLRALTAQQRALAAASNAAGATPARPRIAAAQSVSSTNGAEAALRSELAAADAARAGFAKLVAAEKAIGAQVNTSSAVGAVTALASASQTTAGSVAKLSGAMKAAEKDPVILAEAYRRMIAAQQAVVAAQDPLAAGYSAQVARLNALVATLHQYERAAKAAASAPSVGANASALRTSIAATERASMANTTLTDRLRKASDAAGTQAAALGKVRSVMSATTGATNDASAATSRFADRIRALGSASAVTEEKTASIGSSLRRLAGLAAGAFGARELAGISDAYTTLSTRVGLVTKNEADRTATLKTLNGIADRTRNSITDTAELYVKLRMAQQTTGLSTQQTTDLTEAFGLALKVSGASGASASSAIQQFAQAMNTGTLASEEFRTVNENAPVVIRLLEQSLGVTRKELLRMREAGELTSKMVANALIPNLEKLRGQVGDAPMTIADGFVALRNSLIRTVGGSKDLQTAAQGIATGLRDIGKYLEENGPLLLGLAKAAALFYGITKAIGFATGAVKLLSLAITASPIGIALRGAAVAVGTLEVIAGRRQQQREAETSARADAYANLSPTGKASAARGLDMEIARLEQRVRTAKDESGRLLLGVRMQDTQNDLALAKAKRTQLVAAGVPRIGGAITITADKSSPTGGGTGDGDKSAAALSKAQKLADDAAESLSRLTVRSLQAFGKSLDVDLQVLTVENERAAQEQERKNAEIGREIASARKKFGANSAVVAALLKAQEGGDAALVALLKAQRDETNALQAKIDEQTARTQQRLRLADITLKGLVPAPPASTQNTTAGGFVTAQRESAGKELEKAEEREKDAAERSKQRMQALANGLQSALATGIESVFTRGLRGVDDFWSTFRSTGLRVLAELAASKLLGSITTAFSGKSTGGDAVSAAKRIASLVAGSGRKSEPTFSDRAPSSGSVLGAARSIASTIKSFFSKPATSAPDTSATIGTARTIANTLKSVLPKAAPAVAMGASTLGTLSAVSTVAASLSKLTSTATAAAKAAEKTGNAASTVSSAASGGSRLGGGLAIAGVGFGLGNVLGQQLGSGKGAAAGALAGAASGAIIGSFVPVVGTVLGGIIGGAAGLLGGLFGGSKKKKAQQELARQASSALDSLTVRALAAAGDDFAANKKRLELEQKAELDAAIKQFGAASEVVRKLRDVQAAEAKKQAEGGDGADGYSTGTYFAPPGFDAAPYRYGALHQGAMSSPTSDSGMTLTGNTINIVVPTGTPRDQAEQIVRELQNIASSQGYSPDQWSSAVIQ